jgi:DNA-binding transcriptional regulator YiaG
MATATRNKSGRAKKRAKTSGARFDVGALRVALAKAAGAPKVSRPALAKLVGAHPNSIALWESGRLIGAKYLAKLSDLKAKIAKGEKVTLPAGKKGGRPKKAGARKQARTSRTTAAAPVNVKSLRASLGASRDAFAKLLGVSPGSILNWESGRSKLTEKNAAKLADLAARAKAGEIASLSKRKGRPPKGASRTAAVASSRRAAAITGACPLLYANAVAIEAGRRDARIRFALELPRGEWRAIVDVMVPSDVLGEIQGR